MSSSSHFGGRLSHLHTAVGARFLQARVCDGVLYTARTYYFGSARVGFTTDKRPVKANIFCIQDKQSRGRRETERCMRVCLEYSLITTDYGLSYTNKPVCDNHDQLAE